MAHKLIWSPEALLRLRQISDYMSADSVLHTNATIKKIVDAVHSLERFPRLKRKLPEANRDELREILVLSWRIVYEISDYSIDLIDIVQGAQRWRG